LRCCNPLRQAGFDGLESARLGSVTAMRNLIDRWLAEE
jgi:hypothetical protein